MEAIEENIESKISKEDNSIQSGQKIKIRSNELFRLKNEFVEDELAGVSIKGVHYYDFKDVHFINNTGLASLIDLLKCLLQKGVEIRFVNVSEKIKDKIKSLGLENILRCQ